MSESALKWFAHGELAEALIMFPATPMLHTFGLPQLLSSLTGEKKPCRTGIGLGSALADGIIMPFAESEIYILKLMKELQRIGIYSEEIEKVFSLTRQFRTTREKIRGELLAEKETYGLSEQELAIARLAAEGKTNWESTQELHFAEGMVCNQLSRIFDKLDITGDGRNQRIQLKDLLP